MISSFAFAQKKQVEVISRFDSHQATSIVANELLKIVNKQQNEYEFRFSVLPGAGGETADQRAIVLAQSGQLSMVIGSSPSWGINRYTYGNTFDRDNDLVPILGMGGTPFAIQVAPNSGINTVDELVEKLRGKSEAFHGSTAASVASRFMANMFIDHYKLTNIKHITYRLPGDMIRGILGGEADFAVYNTADGHLLKSIAVTSDKRYVYLPDVATGKEIGFPEFEYTTLTTISTPKENRATLEKIAPLFVKACKTEEIQALFEKIKQIPFCYNTEQSLVRIRSEIQLLKKYEHLIK